MTNRTLPRVVAVLAFALSGSALADPTAYKVNPERGANAFTATYDAPLGERIVATSSAVGCELTYDAKANLANGTCKVALPSVMVDNNETKTEHFQQWVTNKKSDPKKCVFEAKLENVKLEGPLVEGQRANFSADVPFTVCGKKREDGKPEHLSGNVILLPGADKTLRVRAKIEEFDREAYQIGPKWTEGWAAKIQFLAPVVAPKGTVELNFFADPAKPVEAKAEKKK